MQNLNDIDFQILAFIYQNEPVHISKIQKHFPKISALEHRLNKLCKPEIGSFGMPLPDSSYIKERHSTTEKDDRGLPVRLGIYKTTDFGKTTAEDYLQDGRTHKKELWLTNAKIPIIVTLVTNLLVAVLKWLSPQILEWCTNFLERISS